eukprot:m.347706 g.347706  ORF g.347706 m.347706 type:complete len:314 (+) comp33813_c0_seq1:225-1166(+)
MENALHVFVVGKAGVGKSYFIRTQLQKMGCAVPGSLIVQTSPDYVTKKPTEYPCQKTNIVFIDTAGFDVDKACVNMSEYHKKRCVFLLLCNLRWKTEKQQLVDLLKLDANSVHCFSSFFFHTVSELAPISSLDTSQLSKLSSIVINSPPISISHQNRKIKNVSSTSVVEDPLLRDLSNAMELFSMGHPSTKKWKSSPKTVLTSKEAKLSRDDVQKYRYVGEQLLQYIVATMKDQQTAINVAGNSRLAKKVEDIPILLEWVKEIYKSDDIGDEKKADYMEALVAKTLTSKTKSIRRLALPVIKYLLEEDQTSAL